MFDFVSQLERDDGSLKSRSNSCQNKPSQRGPLRNSLHVVMENSIRLVMRGTTRDMLFDRRNQPICLPVIGRRFTCDNRLRPDGVNGPHRLTSRRIQVDSGCL